MAAGHPGGSGDATRVCPHCKSTILTSVARCPACQHYLRFDASPEDAPETITALKVDGTIAHANAGEPWEYQVVIAIRDESGHEITRTVVGVGVLERGEQRSFQLAVEVMPTPQRRRQA